MQPTRNAILEYLKEHGAATVDELAGVLKLTPVTVRHHLDILRGDELVAEPEIRHRSTPGRPQYSYSLTAKASRHFPKNYCDLAGQLIAEVKAHAEPGLINVIFDGVAERLVAGAPPPRPGEPLEARLERAVEFLNARGYVARWEAAQDAPEAGYWLHTCNCPYESLAGGNPELCAMDLSLMEKLLGAEPRCASRVAEGGASCAYWIADNKVELNLTN